MRLIDEEKLMEDIQKTITEQSGTIDWMNLIYRQPTAYDVDKVVDQLESLSNAEADYYYARSNDVIDREDAIDIVKKGGGVDASGIWEDY